MQEYQNIVQTIALTLGAAWGSGINLYAAVLMIGGMGLLGDTALPPGLEMLADPLVMGAAGLMYVIEFFADKVPGVDTGWDTLHTFIRIPAGALLAYGATNSLDPSLAIAAGLVGGTLSAGAHATKAGTRVMINTSPEPFSNWAASVGEDLAVLGGLWTALHYPMIFIGLLIVFIILAIWLLPKIWRGIKKVFGFLFNILKRSDQTEPVETGAAAASQISAAPGGPDKDLPAS